MCEPWETCAAYLIRRNSLQPFMVANYIQYVGPPYSMIIFSKILTKTVYCASMRARYGCILLVHG